MTTSSCRCGGMEGKDRRTEHVEGFTPDNNTQHYSQYRYDNF